MYWQTSEFEISGYDKCKTWFVDTTLQKKKKSNSVIASVSVPVIKSNPV